MAIQQQQFDAVSWITIDRKSVLNALDIPHLRNLLAAINDADNDQSTRCIVITGTGRAFSVGADIKAMDRMDTDEFAQAAALYQDLCRAARGSVSPIIAAINGYALGGGLEIALMADIRIAAKSAKLGLPDAELGFSPTGGMTYLLNRIVGTGWAMHLALTAEILDAEKALSLGLVTSVSEDNSIESDAMELSAKIAGFPRTGIRNIKRSMIYGQDADLELVLNLEEKLDAECYANPETRKALREFTEKRKKQSGNSVAT